LTVEVKQRRGEQGSRGKASIISERRCPLGTEVFASGARLASGNDGDIALSV
jgi:hypothetical protein